MQTCLTIGPIRAFTSFYQRAPCSIVTSVHPCCRWWRCCCCCDGCCWRWWSCAPWSSAAIPAWPASAWRSRRSGRSWTWRTAALEKPAKLARTCKNALFFPARNGVAYCCFTLTKLILNGRSYSLGLLKTSNKIPCSFGDTLRFFSSKRHSLLLFSPN